MTLKADILARTDLAALVAARNDAAIAVAMSAGRVKLVPTEIGNGLILETVGIAVGNALLDTINGAADFRYVKPLLDQGRLRIDSALVRATLDSLVGVVSGFTQAHADAIKALALAANPYSVGEISEALNG